MFAWQKRSSTLSYKTLCSPKLSTPPPSFHSPLLLLFFFNREKLTEITYTHLAEVYPHLSNKEQTHQNLMTALQQQPNFPGRGHHNAPPYPPF